MSLDCLQTEVGRVLVAGSGFLADGYDLYVIGEVENVLKEQYVCGRPNADVDCISEHDFKKFLAMISSAALWGAVAGQIIFGTLADRIGRRNIFIVTGGLIVCGSVISGCCLPFGRGPRFMLYQLAFFRGVLGFGIGGEYPLSATICAEGTAPRKRATMMSLVFANQGLGYLLSASIMVILAYMEVSLEFFWRFPLVFGAVVPCISLFFRMKMHESDDFTKVQKSRSEGARGVDTVSTAKRYAWHVLGTAGNWFIFDVFFYANSLFNADVLRMIEVGPGGLKSTMLKTLVVVLIMLPGYFVGIALINKLGRKLTQIQGYCNMVFWFGICGIFYSSLKEMPGLFVLIYGMTFFFSNFGPNLTTYVIPGEIYPSQAKATLHGCSAAAGKLGAAIGSMSMPFVTGQPATPDGIRLAMLICSGLAAGGLILTLLLTPNYGPADLEPQENEETVGFVPLFFQKKMKQSEWDAMIDDSEEESDSDGDSDAS